MRTTLQKFLSLFSSKTDSESQAKLIQPEQAIPSASILTTIETDRTKVNLGTKPQTTQSTVAAPNDISSELAGSTTITGTQIFTPWKSSLPIDSLFFDWSMAYPGEGCNLEIEQKVLLALFNLLSSDLNDATVVPRVPSIVPQLLASLRSRHVSTGEISRQIVKDVVLVGEVINAVNSALYNPADRISSLENAVMMLGEDGLRLLIAKVAFRPIINLNAGMYTRRAAPHIWAQSEKCAIACRELAITIDPFLAFLTGMIKNVGLIIAFRLLDQVCEQPKFSYSRAFQQTFCSVAATLSYRIAQRWGFPIEILLALQQQTPGSKAVNWSELGYLLHNADLLAKMRILLNQRQIKITDQGYLSGLSAAEIACFDSLNQVTQY